MIIPHRNSIPILDLLKKGVFKLEQLYMDFFGNLWSQKIQGAWKQQVLDGKVIEEVLGSVWLIDCLTKVKHTIYVNSHDVENTQGFNPIIYIVSFALVSFSSTNPWNG